MNKIAGVVFDLDGTLYRLSWHLRAIITVMVFPRVGRLCRFIAAHTACAGIDFGSRESLLDEICSVVARSSRRSSLAELRRWIDRSFYPAFVKSLRVLRWQRRRNLCQTLQLLRNAGVPTAVLSDYGYAKERLHALGVPLSLFIQVASAEDYGALKPAPRPFLTIARQWQVAPECILVVGDRIDTDGAAAARAGMQFVHLSDKPDHASGWEEVKALLQRFCGGGSTVSCVLP